MLEEGARYGIWGVDPYGPTIQQTAMIPNIINTGLQTAQKVGALYAQNYANKQAAAKAQLAQGTVGSQIDATNAMNQANQENYPLQQQYKTQQDEATVNEIMARTGVSYAQAQNMLASSGAENARANLYNTQAQRAGDPTAMFDTLYSRFKASPPNSPQRYMYYQLVNRMLDGGTGGQEPSTSTRTQNTGTVPQIMGGGAPSNIQINPLQSSSRSGYRQAATTDANGNPVTIESPTQTSAGRNQMRGEAEAEANNIMPSILAGTNNYQSVFPSLSLTLDSIAARGKGPAAEEAKKRLLDYATARRFVSEVTSINARQGTGQAPGIEVQRDYQHSLFPNLPSDASAKLIPPDIKIKAANAYPQIQQTMVNQALNQERTGYQQPGAPGWSANANVSSHPNGYIDMDGNFHPPTQSSSDNTANTAVLSPALNAMARDAIAKGADPEKVMARLRKLQGGG